MGLQKRERKMYLRISAGKIRQKSTKEDPEAEERFTEIDGKFHYERVFTSCEGFLRDINVQTHEEYGTTYNVELYDPETGQTFSLAIPEKSRYFSSLAMHLPNVDFSKPVIVSPYSFKNEGRTVIGLTLKQGDTKVENYYRKVVDAKATPPVTKPTNGLEKFDFTMSDKDELKIEQLKQLKFLKGELKQQIIRLSEYVEENVLPGNTEKQDSDEPEEKTPAKKADKKTTDGKSKSTKNSKPEKGRKGSGRKGKDEDDDLPY